MKINQTNTNSAIALCVVAVLSFIAPALQAGSNPFNGKVAIDERSVPPIVAPIVQPGGDPISSPGGGRPGKIEIQKIRALPGPVIILPKLIES